MDVPTPTDARLQAARGLLAAAQRVCVLTGAGVSAESGVPTFRGAGGLWRDHDPMSLATPEAFSRDPVLVWDFYNWRRTLITKVQPNPAHHAIVRLEARAPHFTLVTQNVDGLHRRAGNQHIIELHGDIWSTRCLSCGDVVLDHGPDRVDLGPAPACQTCGGLLRPNVVWFGENLDPHRWQAAVEACATCQVLLVVGTSATVQPAASLALLAKERGATVIEVNLEPTAHSDFLNVTLLGKAGEILPRLVPDV